MTCPYPVRECLADHYAFHLDDAKLAANGLSLRARCPACGTGDCLSIRAGQRQRVIWHCHHRPGCDGADVRRALLNAGIHASCIPGGDGAERDILADADAAICERGGTRPAITLLRVVVILRGHTRWPDLAELVQIASERHQPVDSRRARNSGPLVTSPRNTSTYQAFKGEHVQAHVGPACRAGVQGAPVLASAPVLSVNSAPVLSVNTVNSPRGGFLPALSPEVREAIIKRRLNGESYRAIAAAEHVSTGSVHNVVTSSPQ